MKKIVEAIDNLEDVLARYFADKDVPLEIRQAVDRLEIALAQEGQEGLVQLR